MPNGKTWARTVQYLGWQTPSIQVGNHGHLGPVPPGTWQPNEKTRIILARAHQIGKITQLNHS